MISGSAFPPHHFDQRSWLWIGLIGTASILLSRAFACATPFAALATLSAFTLRRRQSVALIVSVWFMNQLIGFGWLHYPWAPSTFAWGMAIGVAALASLTVACEVARRTRTPLWISVPLTLTAAFAAYELILYASTTFLPAGPGAFASLVLLRIATINATALGLLLSAHFMARTVAGHRAQGTSRSLTSG
jgi:hypothetical protein